MIKKIILASSSPQRKSLLERFTKSFTIIPANIDEFIDNNKNIYDEILKISENKARFVAENHNNSIIIAADTVVIYNDKVYGKPTSETDAINILKSLSGNTHKVVTAVTIVDGINKKKLSFLEVSKVTFIEYNDKTIQWYISTKEPFDKAGAYGIQGLGSVLVEKIEGDYDNIVGLPIGRILRETFKNNINIYDQQMF